MPTRLESEEEPGTTLPIRNVKKVYTSEEIAIRLERIISAQQRGDLDTIRIIEYALRSASYSHSREIQIHIYWPRFRHS